MVCPSRRAITGPEFEYVAMWAFFAADGERVMKAVADFRALEDRYMPED